MEYLLNGPRWIARNPNIPVPYGTTGCEAVHGELAKFFSGVMQQTARHARAMVSMFCFKKLVLGVMQRLQMSGGLQPQQLLALGVRALADANLQWPIPFNIRTVPYPHVDITQLPSSVLLPARTRHGTRGTHS